MKATSNDKPIDLRDMYYFRQRQKNKVFQQMTQRFYELARNEGLTQKELALRARKDPARVNRLMSAPGNFTLDTISDLLLAMGAEMTHEVVSFAQYKQPAQSANLIRIQLKNGDHNINTTFPGSSTPATINEYSSGR
jgi:hypothetical protein